MKAVKAMQASLAEERLKQSWDEKFKRAEEKRNLHLKTIQEKAHDEAIKLREIAFIKELEAQNKKHDMDALWQVSGFFFLDFFTRELQSRVRCGWPFPETGREGDRGEIAPQDHIFLIVLKNRQKSNLPSCAIDSM